MKEYIELIVEKAELLRNLIKHCVSSDIMLWADIYIEDIIRAANALRRELNAD